MSPHTDEFVVYYRKNRPGRRAQALLEYVLALASLLVVVSIMAILVRGALRGAERTENLVSAECP